MDPTYPLVPVANIISLVLVLVTFLVNVRESRLVGVWMYVLWVGVMALIHSVNFIVWSDNANDVAPVWCDITTHIEVGSDVALPACSLVITRRIYLLVIQRGSPPGAAQPRRGFLFDLTMCLGLPLVVIGLSPIIQYARYDIEEEIGCASEEISAGLTILLRDSWAVVLPGISALFYCPRIMLVFYRRRKEVQEVLSSQVLIRPENYLHVMALGCLDILVTLPIGILDFVLDFSPFHDLRFWPGWAAAHEDWHKPIDRFTATEWHSSVWDNFGVRISEWTNVLLALIFFLLFGLTRKARARYACAFWTIARPLGFKPRPADLLALSDIVFASNPSQTAIEISSASIISAVPKADIEYAGSAHSDAPGVQEQEEVGNSKKFLKSPVL